MRQTAIHCERLALVSRSAISRAVFATDLANSDRTRAPAALNSASAAFRAFSVTAAAESAIWAGIGFVPVPGEKLGIRPRRRFRLLLGAERRALAAAHPIRSRRAYRGSRRASKARVRVRERRPM